MLNHEEQRRALTYVRQLITSALHQQDPPDVPAEGVFANPCGAFVTLQKAGYLRGCIGMIEAALPLGRTLQRMAIAAAFDDPRFPGIKPDEWEQCTVEISVLSEPQDVESFHRIEIGRHGVILSLRGRSAVFLPQVAPEQGWTREQMLHHLCRKAGLPADAWTGPECAFRVFEAQVFAEAEE